MLRLRKLMPVVAAVLMAAIMLGTAPSAEAAITIAISTDGGVNFTGATGTTVSGGENAKTFTTTFTTAGGTDISVTASTNQPLQPPLGTADFAQVAQTQINISGNNADTIALVVRVSDVDFVLPVGVSTLSSSFSGSIGGGNVASPLASLGTFQSVADFNSGVLFGGLPGVPGSAPPGSDDTTGLQLVAVVPVVGLTTSFKGDTSKQTVSTAPFSLSNEFRFVAPAINPLGLTSLVIPAGGAQFQFTGTTTLTAVPAPAGVVLALTALPVLGLGRWVRRRRKLA